MGMFYIKGGLGGKLDQPKTEYCVFLVTTKLVKFLWLIVFGSDTQKKELPQECFFCLLMKPPKHDTVKDF